MANFKIAYITDNGRAHTYGASTDTKLLTVPAGSTAVETDTNDEFVYNGDNTAAGWAQTATNGVAHALQYGADPSGNPEALKSKDGAQVSPTLSYVKYADGTYEYYCEATIGTARSTALWQVVRKTIATGDMIYAGTGLYEHAATSLAVVTALTYTLGA